MKRIIPLLLLLMALMMVCEPLAAYFIATDQMEWRFIVTSAPSAPVYSISGADVEKTSTGYIVTVTFSPEPGPQEIHLTLPEKEE